jgi:hypothetical protein
LAPREFAAPRSLPPENAMNAPIRVVIACSIAVLAVGCGKDEKAAADSAAAAAAAAAPAPPPPPAAFSLAEAAGQWQVRAVPESGADTTSTNYVLTATADTTGWLITFPNGLKVPMQVMVSGDSVITKTGEFASQRRKNMKVMTENSMKLVNGKLIGSTIAHYMKAGADSVLRLRTEGTKMP